MYILYAGDSGPQGVARYLLAILKSMGAKTTHVLPSQKLSARLFRKKYDAVLLSDFPAKNAPLQTQKMIARQVHDGTGLMMIGGWASFSGPLGRWKGSLIEKLLPIYCLPTDDRINFPGGAYPVPCASHVMFKSFFFKNPPSIVGANRLRIKKNGEAILMLQKIVAVGNHLTLDPVGHPLFVIDKNPVYRIAAYASDFAPHWCGGLVDWGQKSLRLPVGPSRGCVEIGSTYVEFVSRMLRWLARIRY